MKRLAVVVVFLVFCVTLWIPAGIGEAYETPQTIAYSIKYTVKDPWKHVYKGTLTLGAQGDEWITVLHSDSVHPYMAFLSSRLGLRLLDEKAGEWKQVAVDGFPLTRENLSMLVGTLMGCAAQELPAIVRCELNKLWAIAAPIIEEFVQSGEVDLLQNSIADMEPI